MATYGYSPDAIADRLVSALILARGPAVDAGLAVEFDACAERIIEIIDQSLGVSK